VTANELTNLQATAARLYELAAFYAPHYAQEDVQACWRDLCALIGVEAEAVALAAARECQSDMFAELWIRPV
jgi:hypothetical protein